MSSNELTLINGASSDIGFALCKRLLETTPATILAHSYRSGERTRGLQNEFGDRVIPITADFSDANSVAAMAEEVTSRGVPSAVVHLPASKLSYERFTKFDWKRFETDLAIQVQAPVLLLKKLVPKMAKLPRARVVFVLSSAVRGMPPKYMSAYTIAKYAQLGLMRSLAAEYSGTGLTVNAISPSMVETQFLSEIGDVAIQMSAASNPLSRNAQPEDLIGSLCLLLSPGADDINGIDITIAAGAVC